MKKYRAGRRVSGLEELKTLRVVYVVPWQRAHPVAFFCRGNGEWLTHGFRVVSYSAP